MCLPLVALNVATAYFLMPSSNCGRRFWSATILAAVTVLIGWGTWFIACLCGITSRNDEDDATVAASCGTGAEEDDTAIL